MPVAETTKTTDEIIEFLISFLAMHDADLSKMVVYRRHEDCLDTANMADDWHDFNDHTVAFLYPVKGPGIGAIIANKQLHKFGYHLNHCNKSAGTRLRLRRFNEGDF